MHSRGNVELMGDPLGGLNHIIDGLDLRSLGDILDGIHDVSKLVMHKLILNYVGLSNNSVHGNHVIGRFKTRVNDLALHRQWSDLLNYRVYGLGRSRARKGWHNWTGLATKDAVVQSWHYRTHKGLAVGICVPLHRSHCLGKRSYYPRHTPHSVVEGLHRPYAPISEHRPVYHWHRPENWSRRPHIHVLLLDFFKDRSFFAR